MSNRMHLGLLRISLGVAVIALFAGHAAAQTPVIPPVIGSPNTVTANPTVPVPPTTPCVVTLFDNFEFDNFNAQTFTYTPPANCPGPWAKIVFEADFNVTPGVQYDRTGAIYLGHANIYFGTTAEPGETFGPSWHVERDVTDYSSLFAAQQSGEVDLGNLVNSTYTGIIYGTAAVFLYPSPDGQNAPVTPDDVYPMPDAPGGAVALNTTTDQLSQQFTLPTNIERAYLDVITQNQSDDEFFYTCVPNDVATELESCGNTAFREAEISIDGQPAGVAPTYPWIFTGGVDPFLWFPLPGIQTMEFVPYRVDLTPFAGLLSNGQPHTLAVSVYNADSYFSATASLLVYLDHGSSQVNGAVTSNTLSATPSPNVDENLTTNPDGSIDGTVTVSAKRNYEISGYVNTSHGRVSTTVLQNIDYVNSQQFTINATEYIQDISQRTGISSATITHDGLRFFSTAEEFNYPLTFNISVVVNSDGSENQSEVVHQGWDRSVISPTFLGTIANTEDSTDTLLFDASGNFTGNQGQASKQSYKTFNTTGYFYDCTLQAENNVLTSIGRGCEQ